MILLGDLFDFWVSPAQARDALWASVSRALDDLLAAGVDVGFVEGNRDFAASPELRRLGVEILADVGVVESGGRRVAYTHGDLLCARDVRYQALRRVARRATTRHLLQALPARWALGVGRGARAGSQLETTRKSYGDMGLSGDAVHSLLRRLDADALVCGHVHWGRRHVVEVDGAPRDVVVLSAWEDVATYAHLEDGRMAFVRFLDGAELGPNPSRAGDDAG